MVARVAFLCVVEAAVAAVLAMQVFADRVAPPANQGAGRPAAPIETQEPASGAPAAAPDGRTAAVPSPVPQREAVAEKWRLDDPVGVLLTGRLQLRDGSPADANVALARDQQRAYASAAADGSFALVGLSPGEWQATVGGKGIVQLDETLTLTDDAVQQHDFVLDASFPVRVVIVTPDGQDATRAVRLAMSGWSDFAVAAQRDAFPERLAPTDYGMVFVGDARWDSEMNPRDGFAGTLHLASLPAHVALLQRHIVLQQQVVRPGQAEVKFVVDVDVLKTLAASATLRVLDAVTGEPIAKARVGMATSNRAGMGQPVDGDGRVVLEGLSPGLLRCTITAPDHESYFHTVRVESGHRLDLGDVRLGPANPLTGTVLGPDGKPAGASLQWTELKWRTSPAQFSHNRSANTEADGTFKLWGTGDGPIAVTAHGHDHLVAAAVVDNPPAEPLVLRLAPACRCEVTRPADPTRAFTLTLCDAQSRPVAAYAIEPRQTKLTASLPAGTYSFTVHDQQDRLVQSGSLTFGAEPCALEIR